MGWACFSVLNGWLGHDHKLVDQESDECGLLYGPFMVLLGRGSSGVYGTLRFSLVSGDV